ncbi:MAG: TlyA family RNA methyltransferase [Patescibacteria group bacterium]
MEKERLDVEMVKRGLVKSRAVAVRLISEKQVLVAGAPATKTNQQVTADAKIELLSTPKFVGRGGEKLAAALSAFNVNPKDLIALDVGSSTGGFTDCLLQAGAQKVYAVDVGTDQFDPTLKKDPRVVLMEQTDIRNVTSLPDPIDLAVIDVSFISLTKVLPAASKLVKKSGAIIALIKPQFETSPESKNRAGVIVDEKIREQALQSVLTFVKEIGLHTVNTIPSPVAGGEGNFEYLVHFKNKSD